MHVPFGLKNVCIMDMVSVKCTPYAEMHTTKQIHNKIFEVSASLYVYVRFFRCGSVPIELLLSFVNIIIARHYQSVTRFLFFVTFCCCPSLYLFTSFVRQCVFQLSLLIFLFYLAYILAGEERSVL